ncbi:MAG: tRNA (N6-isopentenyl adenosine(37)-C2)-methylthiotransferase MiaB [Acidiferrobacteraceae bacterium]|nr:tRNA (N6-isopentenyl adenosine(37)-C2)-methylthiotransferase MiaB [Acidiferrobacteraceae bacterium]
MRRTFSDCPLAKKVFIKSYGCQMNVYDSARMGDVLAREGYIATDAPSNADLVILNTCHIREKAAEKVYSELGRLRSLKESGMLIAVAGCVAQAEGEEIMRRAPYVDFVVGPQNYHQLAKLVSDANLTQKSSGLACAINTDFPAESKFDFLPEARASGPAVFLTIQEGCDKFCSFCVVPYTRGVEFSRPASSVLEEARQLVNDGATEITLLGQNVNAYHGDEGRLAGLIQKLSEIGGLNRIRYTTSHPRDMDKDLIAAHGSISKLMPHLHLPVQSGSDATLARMNRQHVADDYLRIIDKLRAARPDIALSSDFIVGHPGETDADFEATLALVDAVGYAQAYSFKYSKRPGTPASDRDDQVPEHVKSDRLEALQNLLNRQHLEFNKSFVGKVVPVLFERRGKLPHQIAGRTPYMQAVYVDCENSDRADQHFGKILPIRIFDAFANSLTGIIETPIERRESNLMGRLRG